MSYYLVDFDKFDKEANTIDFDLANLIIDNKIEFGEDKFKYLVYYNTDIARDIYIKTPKIRLAYDWTNLKYSSMKIRIAPKYSKTTEFIKFIKKLEKELENNKTINKKNTLTFKSILVKENNVTHIKTYFNDKTTKITSNLKSEINITDFKANGEIQLVIKINGVWQKGTSYGLSTQIYQVKYFSPPDASNFIDMIDSDNKPVYKTPPPVKQHTEDPVKVPIIAGPRLAINAEMLKSIKLKAVDKVV